MHGQQRSRGAKFDGKIPVAHGVHGILGELRPASGIHKAKQFGDEYAVERQRGTGHGAAAERTDVHARIAVPEPFAIAFQHFDVGQQMMRKINRLRALQVRVAGNQDVGILFAERNQRPLQIARFRRAARRSRRAARAAYRARPGRCASGRCAVSRRPARAASIPPRCSCAHLRGRLSTEICPARFPGRWLRGPARWRCVQPWRARRFFGALSAWTSEPRMSCRQSRQSNEMDSVNCATSAAGPPANRPLRETGEIFFMRFDLITAERG